MSKPSKIQRRSIKISHASVSDKTMQKGVRDPLSDALVETFTMTRHRKATVEKTHF